MKGKFKQAVIWGILLIMVISYFPQTATADMADTSQNYYIDVDSIPSGKAGKNITIKFKFTAKGRSMNDVRVQLVRYLPEDEREDGSIYSPEVGYPFELTSNLTSVKKIGNISNGSSKTVTLTYKLRKDLKEGYYPVAFDLSEGDTGLGQEVINIWVGSSADSTEDEKESIGFVLGENQETPKGVYPNVMNFSVNVRNKSGITAQDVSVKMVVSEDGSKFPFDINEANYDRYYAKIEGGETVQPSYSMAIRKDIYSGYYPLKFLIEYQERSDGERKSIEETVYVSIKNKEKEKEESSGEFNANDRVKARLVVDSFQTIPETIYAGDEFELVLHMKNASEQVAASNILFTIESEKTSDSAVFTTDSGASSLVVNSLGAGQTTELRIKLTASAAVDQKSYSMDINQKYDSPQYKNAEEKVSISIPVRQKPRLNTGTIEVMPDNISVGAESNIMFSINNTGRVLLYNVMVQFEGDSIQGTDTYVGNIRPGETGSVDVMITGLNPTQDDGKIKMYITYEDEAGEVCEPIEKEISLMVTDEIIFDDGMEVGMFDDIPMEDQESSKGNNIYLYAAILVILAAGGGITAAVIGKKRKKAKIKEDLEDEI